MRIALLLLLLGSTVAGASEITAERAESPGEPVRYGNFGVMLDFGVPYGASASVLFRPVPMLRFHGGPAHNGLAAGGRGGVAFVPFQSFVRPALLLEAGFLPPGDGRLLSRWVGRAELAALSQLSYRFASAKLGLELGSSRRFSFLLQGGLSYIDGAVPQYKGAGFSVEGVKLQLVVPSASAGFSLFFG